MVGTQWLRLALSWLERVLLVLVGILIGSLVAIRHGETALALKWDWPASSEEKPSTQLSPPRTEGPDTTAVNVLGVASFANGRSDLDSTDRNRVRSWASALSQCDEVRVSVVGTTSSSPFSGKGEKSNIVLAAERTRAVATLLEDAGLKLEPYSASKSEQELRLIRRFSDRKNGRVEPSLASVARRADLIIYDLGSCADDNDVKASGTG